MKNSPHHKDGRFRNLSHTPQFTEGYTMLKVIWEKLFTKVPDRVPKKRIPAIKTDLKRLPEKENILVWFGHSSYFMQVEGKRFLVDPVFSGNASPIPNTVKAFKGTDVYVSEDMPGIDCLFITHDHYDHLDYQTIVKLRQKIKTVVCGLGAAEYFVKWGFRSEQIVETGWNSTFSLDGGFVVHTLPARHFSGRGLKRNNTLWCSYLLQTPSLKIYLGGDSGYDAHFAEIGKKFREIDLAILENGQYNNAWRYIHMFPHEVLQAAQDLKTKRLFPVHSGKFALSGHAWYEPLTKITELNGPTGIPLITPRIGEKVYLSDDRQSFSRWWNL